MVVVKGEVVEMELDSSIVDFIQSVRKRVDIQAWVVFGDDGYKYRMGRSSVALPYVDIKHDEQNAVFDVHIKGMAHSGPYEYEFNFPSDDDTFVYSDLLCFSLEFLGFNKR